MNVDPESGRMTGAGNYEPSFGLGKYDAYFCADFRGAAVDSAGSFKSSVFPELYESTGIYAPRQPKHGVYVRFQDAGPADLARSAHFLVNATALAEFIWACSSPEPLDL